MNIETNAIHIKVEYNNEFRRFSLEPSFHSLTATLRRSFCLVSPLQIKFLDDEEDWVVISSDQELLYAVELNGSPLRLSIKTEVGLPSSSTVNSDIPKFQRGGWRRGGGRGRGAGVSPQERLAGKRIRLSERIANLEFQLKAPELKSERQRVLLWRLQSLQLKLSGVIERQTALDQTTPDSSAPSPPVEEELAPRVACQGPFHGHRGGHRGGCGSEGHCGGRGRGRGRARFGLHHANDPTGVADNLTHFQQCKFNLRAARQSGNPEEIEAAKNALQQAKAERKADPNRAHLAELREKKKASRAALREAQSVNNEAEIRACKEALAEAIQQLRDAKKHVHA